MTEIYVLDIETTGLEGALGGDKVLEVGVAGYNPTTGAIMPVYHDFVKQDLTDGERRAWVFSHSDLTPEEVESPGNPDIGEVIASLNGIAEQSGAAWTSYNTDFDYTKFLMPLGFDPGRRAPDIMEVYAGYVGSERWLPAWSAYRSLCGSDPLELGRAEAHRALKDAMMEAHILGAMCIMDDGIGERYREAAA